MWHERDWCPNSLGVYPRLPRIEALRTTDELVRREALKSLPL